MTELIRMHEMEWFAERVKSSCYHISEHVIRSLMAKKLTIDDIESSLLSGSVLEEHHHELRGKSYLVCGLSGERPVHLCVADGKNGWLIIVFAYIPSLPVWKTPNSRSGFGERVMSENMKACYFCGGEIKEITVGNFDYRLEGQLYVIKKVPAGLCQQCGEKYVETEVARKLNTLIDKEKFSGSEDVRVIEYNQINE
jgi:YgiT-type zinc finger domain-containing protein